MNRCNNSENSADRGHFQVKVATEALDAPLPSWFKIDEVAKRIADASLLSEEELTQLCHCDRPMGGIDGCRIPPLVWYAIEQCMDPKILKRKRQYSLWTIFQDIYYILDTGSQWRTLKDRGEGFLPHGVVFYYFNAWRKSGMFEEMSIRMVRAVRVLLGRQECPSLAIIDSRSVAGNHYLRNEEKGLDGHKMRKGLKVQIIVEVNGFILIAYVHPANRHDSVGGQQAVKGIEEFAEREESVLLGDKGYAGEEMKKAAEEVGWEIDIRDRTHETHKFTPEPMRWIVERTNYGKLYVMESGLR